MELFFPGWHQPANCGEFDRCCVSIARLIYEKGPKGKKRITGDRKVDFPVKDWILDPRSFKELELYGDFRFTPEWLADRAKRWSKCGNLMGIGPMDYICAPYIRQITGLTVEQGQVKSLDHYDRLHELLAPEGIYVMPTLQGWEPDEYLNHLEMYGERLKPGVWVGVGSLVPKSSTPEEIEKILWAIKSRRPDLQLHGWGIKKRALASEWVWNLLYSADSQAGSLDARWNNCRAIAGQDIGDRRIDANSPLTAIVYAQEVQELEPEQLNLLTYLWQQQSAS